MDCGRRSAKFWEVGESGSVSNCWAQERETSGPKRSRQTKGRIRRVKEIPQISFDRASGEQQDPCAKGSFIWILVRFDGMYELTKYFRRTGVKVPTSFVEFLMVEVRTFLVDWLDV